MKRITLAGILFFIFLVFTSLSYAANSVDSTGGSITGLAISVMQSTSTWQGYFGYVDLASFGYNIPNVWMNTTPESNTTNMTAGDILSTTHVGYLFIVNGTESTLDVGSNLEAGILNDLDNLISPTYDYASNVFTNTTDFTISGEGGPGLISSVPTSYLFGSSGESSVDFREGFLKDTDTGNFVYIVDLWYENKLGFNSSNVTYQYIVPNINDGYSVFVYLENTKPTVTLTAPNGGETWTGIQTITWNANDLDSGLAGLTIDLYYNEEDGAWIPIDTVSGVNSYEWTLPAGPKSNVKINVTVKDDDNLEANDVSDAYFTIPSTDTIPPTVTILHPNASVTYTTSTVDLNVTTNENTDTCLFNIGSGNTTMNKVSSTSFDYLIDVSSKDQNYNLNVYCNDSMGNIGTDGLTFTVDNIQPTLTLNYPTDNKNLTGTVDLIATVSDSDVQSVLFEYNDGTWHEIGTNSTPGTTFSYGWDTSALNLQNVTVRATATDDAGLQNSDTSSNIEIDNTAPAQINDLSASIGTNEGEIDLSWTSKGDDGTTGTATSYIIRYSTSEVNSTTWDTDSSVIQSITPQINGSSETITVTGLNYATQYYFAIKSVDNLGLESVISNSAVSETKSHDLAVTFSTPGSVALNSNVVINASVTNNGNVQEDSTVRFFVDAVEDESRAISLNPGETKYEAFNWIATPEQTNIPLKVQVDTVSYETNTGDNTKTNLVDVIATHDINVNSISCTKNEKPCDGSTTTLYLYDIMNVSADIKNAGNVDETNVEVLLKKGLSTVLQTKYIDLTAGETKTVSFDWNATTTGLYYMRIETAPVPGETANNNSKQTSNLNVYSVANILDNTEFALMFDNSNPSANTNFTLAYMIKEIDASGASFYDLPVQVTVPASMALYECGSYDYPVTCEFQSPEPQYFNVTNGFNQYVYRTLNAGSETGIKDITIRAGNNELANTDSVTVS